jgi:lysozyme family protein
MTSNAATDAAELSQEALQQLVRIRDLDVPATQAERERAVALISAYNQATLEPALRRFREGTGVLLDLIGLLGPRVAALGRGGAQAVASANATLRAVHEAEGLRSAATSPADAETAAASDEQALPPPAAVPAQRLLTPAVTGSRLDAPRPIDSRSYGALADEYVRFFLGADISTDAASVKRQADRAIAAKARYEAVSGPIAIPWWFVAAIHMLESSFNFETHLHNGDPLNRRTTRVPVGRPANGTPPFTWEASARDALTGHGLAGLTDWSLPRALHRWEMYNGWGYRNRGIASPYLWSMSSIYRRGKFIRDHVFDPDAVSQQCGAATLLKALQRQGAVTLHLDFTDDGAEDDPVSAPPPPPEPAIEPPAAEIPPGSFAAFLLAEMPGLKHFKPEEFLFLGNSHKTAPPASRNTEPDRSLWPNILPLVRTLVAFRTAIGQPVVFNSVYRNAAYNAYVGGERDSQHMKFKACDFHVTSGGSTPEDWAALLRNLRQQGVFSGGIGLYPRFVHVDTRGFNTDWRKP